jgi:glutamate-1-semialdehyde 2,1-aminomutase
MPGGTLHRRASPFSIGENGQVSHSYASIDRGRLSGLIERERSEYRARFPGSAKAFYASGKHLLGGVPMTWMRMWPGGFPVYHATASGARLTDIDGNQFIDFCLGDTGAMAGHSPAPVRAAVAPPVR